MSYYVIDKSCANTIYDNDDFDIILKKFKNKQKAINYLNNNINQISYNVFTDGACSNNGKPNAKAGIGIYFGDNDSRNTSKRIDGIQTNNIAELSAIIEVFNICNKDIVNNININIYSDSKVSIGWCTYTGEKYNNFNWKRKNGEIIQHVDLIKKGYKLFQKYNNVKLHHIKAHTGKEDELSKGNNEADKLANLSIEEDECPYNIDKLTIKNDVINTDIKNKKIYLNIPFDKKDNAKEYGARWDNNVKKWYYDINNKHILKLLALQKS